MHARTELMGLVEILTPLMNSMNQAIAIIDADGNFAFLNQLMADFDDGLPDDAIGKPILERWPYLTENTSTLLKAVRYGETFINQYQSYCSNSGRIRDYIHTTMPLYSQSGNIMGAIEIGQDIGNLKSLSNQILELSEKLYLNNQDSECFPEDYKEIITRDPAMLEIIKQLDLYAQSNVPLLIYGETGTGKEMFVHRAHGKSPRSNKPLVALNCAAIPETLMESILFGTKKGAFTGSENHKGLFEIANGGTIFLDELNSMPISIQAKLLRVLQDGEIRPLGYNKTIKVNVTVIAAMNEEPEQSVENGHLREDLLYRISVGLVYIPPLRERLDDIPLLAEHFVKKYSRELNRNITFINPQTLRELKNNPWPGNVRMLENVIRRSVMLTDPMQTELKDLHLINLNKSNSPKLNVTPDNSGRGEALNGNSLLQQVGNYEKNLIINALHESNGNVTHAASLLQVPRTTLQHKIKRYSLADHVKPDNGK